MIGQRGDVVNRGRDRGDAKILDSRFRGNDGGRREWRGRIFLAWGLCELDGQARGARLAKDDGVGRGLAAIDAAAVGTVQGMVGVFGIQRLSGDAAELAEGSNCRSGRYGFDLDLGEGAPEGRRVRIGVDGAIEVIDEVTYATAEPGQGEQGGAPVDGIEEIGRDGVHLGEGKEVARRELLLVGDAAEGIGEPTLGMGAETPVHSGGTHGVAGGAAQRDGGGAGFAGGQVGVSAVEKTEAALLVMGYGADDQTSIGFVLRQAQDERWFVCWAFSFVLRQAPARGGRSAG